MPEERPLDTAPQESSLAIAQRLSGRVAVIAGRLAELLASSPLTREGSLGQGQSFLKAMFEAAAPASPAVARPMAALQAPRAADPLDRLTEGLALSPVELDLLLLAGMADEHEGYASVLRSLHPRGEPRATSGLAAQLFCRSSDERQIFREVLEHGPAMRSGALCLSSDGPFFERSLLLAEELWPVLGGLDVWPAWLRPIAGPGTRSGLEDWLASPEVARAEAALRSNGPCLLLVIADDEKIGFWRAVALADEARVKAVGLAWPSAPRDETEHVVGLHALARGAVPILRVSPSDPPAVPEAPAFRDFPGPVVVCARSGAVVVQGPRPVVSVHVERLSPSARQRMWSETLPEIAENAPALAARYTIEPFTAAEVAVDVRSLEALQGRRIQLDDVAESVRVRSNLSVSGGVKLVRPTARWEQLVLPQEHMDQLREALDRLIHQAKVLDEWRFLEQRPGARGVRMLFSGPPGTGKTLSAEVLAQSLGVDLLVVDISRVVSKWIGETEKNLAEVFDAAERAQAVLLFDEADALFGRRTEVSDAHDRYANLETAYLLSRLERFEGLAILSTNMRQNIDPAFIRRLEFVVEFDEPSLAERKALWRCHLPKSAPLAPGVDFAELAASYPLVGGLIRNASVAAGFLAAADSKDIARQHLVRAIKREYEKSGKAFPGVPAGLAAPK